MRCKRCHGASDRALLQPLVRLVGMVALRRLLLAGTAVLILAGGSPGLADTRPAATVATSEESLLLAAAEAQADVERGDLKHAREVLEKAWKRKDFAAASPALRRGVLLMIAGLATQDEDWPTAKAAITPASEMAEAEAIDWTLRAEVAARSRDSQDAVLSLTRLAERFPKALADIEDATLYQWRGRARGLPDGEAKVFALTDALMRAGWTPKDPFVDLSMVRREYAQGLIARDRIAEAQTNAALITDADSLIIMRADKRFDRIGGAARPERFSPKAGSVARLKAVEALAAGNPSLLSGHTAKATALIALNRAEEALAVADAAVARATQEPTAFTDLNQALPWAHNVRDTALRWLGRNDEAIEALAIGARVPEHGQANVSQTLNLADAQLDNGQAKAALATVSTVRLDLMSPYGRGVGLRVQACAYALLGDNAAADKAVGAVKALGLEGKTNLSEALMCRDDLDGAAALMIERLADPLERSAALLALQDGPPPPHPRASDLARAKRMAALRVRPDILAAVAPIGRIETYSAEDLWPPR